MHLLHTIEMLRVGAALSILQVMLIGVSSAYSIGDIDPRALRGVWRLTSLDENGLPFERNKQRMVGQDQGGGFFPPHPAPSDPKTIWKLRGFLPMKEFTMYPKKKKSDVEDGTGVLANMSKPTEIFIKLKDDYTFQQCTALQYSDGSDEDMTLEEQLGSEISKREKESFALKGTWDFVDGKLILAADRPEKKPFSIYDDDANNMKAGTAVDADTILVGKVAVQSEDSLTDNPALEQRQLGGPVDDQGEQAAHGKTDLPKKGTIDIHLSVPRGKIKTGKFMYPKHHPSFFEQPIWKPQSNGHFELRQILGEYNAKLEEDKGELVELFRKKDLVGKRFYLSTFPLRKRRKKFERWDAAKGEYVTEEYELTAQERKEEDLKPGENMQVMAVELFANNTFSTLQNQGLGSSTILRGKWSIIGDNRDQLWMQVSRFGFGRSVSGSTYSEGTSLTQNDEKAYWGKIKEIDGDDENNLESKNKKVEIKGSVIMGWGLEPVSVGRYKMIEIEDLVEEEEEDDDEEEDEYEEMSAEDLLENASNLNAIIDLETDSSDLEDGISGAFE